jgi:hypothetical protein
MRDPQGLRELARCCRERARNSLDPGAIDQLRLWAIELADAADEIERRLDEPSIAEIVRISRRG